ncbi:hypothetical protein ACK3YY_11415 [Aeromonas caviae]
MFLVMDRDWGEHSHHRSTGCLLTYIGKGALSLKDLTEGINKFISSLDKDSEGDLFQFNANVCCIYFSVHDKHIYNYKSQGYFFLLGHAFYNAAKNMLRA